MPKLFTKSAFNHAVECPMRAYYYRNNKEYAYHYDGPDGIAEVGDQLFTDVLGANRMNMFSILVKPISKEKNVVGNIKRKVEKIFLKDIR